jgi:Mg-chelatase subunit ChlD
MANIIKGNKVSVGGGLHARLAAKEMLKEQVPKSDPRSMPNRLAIAADFSGSMGSPVRGSYYEENSRTKLELLKDAIQDFALRSDEANTAIAVESFPSGFRIELTNDKQEVWLRIMDIRTLGDTPMGQGLRNALEYHSPTRIMLISDGEATDGDESYKAAENCKQREIIIDTVHIGDSKSGEDRLKRIAEMTGGIYLKFTDVASFSKSFHYLLPESRDAIAGMLPEARARLLGADE